jgi:hypothetical protein
VNAFAEPHVYEMRGYRTLIVIVLLVMTGMFVGLATLAVRGGSAVGALTTLIAYAVLITVGIDAQRRTAVRLTVSAAALEMTWAFGARQLLWSRVRRIRLLHPRWAPERVVRIDLVLDGDRPVHLFERLTEFDRLIAQLRALHSELVEQ